ncbi:MAG: hypothetical protein QM733_03090 [Ilumatobacteraceae bacterium]
MTSAENLLRPTLGRMLSEVCFGGDQAFPLEATIERYVAPDYHQRSDGEEFDYREFVEHIRAVRGRVARGRVEVLELVQEGRQFADRHVVEVTTRDGSSVRTEVHLFGELAEDGRLRRVDEVSRLIAGDDSDRDLARAR